MHLNRLPSKSFYYHENEGNYFFKISDSFSVDTRGKNAIHLPNDEVREVFNSVEIGEHFTREMARAIHEELEFYYG